MTVPTLSIIIQLKTLNLYPEKFDAHSELIFNKYPRKHKSQILLARKLKRQNWKIIAIVTEASS